MTTRAMICVDSSENGRSYALYYRHHDGGPAALGVELLEALRAGKSLEEVIEAVGAEQTSRAVGEPGEAFFRVQDDLEWIY